MKVKVYSLTTDGDNMGIETEVYATEAEARDVVINGLLNGYRTRCKLSREELSPRPFDELSELWSESFDGVCSLEEHVIEDPEVVTF